jgi:hypothetical protein
MPYTFTADRTLIVLKTLMSAAYASAPDAKTRKTPSLTAGDILAVG